jgi:hypothetical protein
MLKYLQLFRAARFKASKVDELSQTKPPEHAAREENMETLFTSMLPTLFFQGLRWW